MRALVPALILGLLSCNSFDPTTPHFGIQGEPIHPACLIELLGWISDAQPVVVAVDVEGSARSNRYFGGQVSKIPGGWEYRNPEKSESEFFRYWPLGITPHGTHVILTADCGGGSGVFYRILFLRLEARSYFNHDQLERRWILSSLGDVGLGDRTRDEASVEGAALLIRSPDGRERRIPIP